jgi:predicted NAD-dependent protein-ADP-ribosyltransferase YbiA (DUF1768 family)
MEQLLMDKFAIPEYRELLLSTGHRDLHEAKGRGAPNQWEYVELSQAQIDAHYFSGGDLLGLLMTRVRARLRDPGDDSDDSDDDLPLAQLAQRQRR